MAYLGKGNNVRQNDTILLIGGGPSECLVDYPDLPATWDTFGMNMAYQYYAELGWWPTFFGCFDRRVTDDQKEPYLKMIEDENCPIEHFYMVQNISKSPRFSSVELHGKTGDFSMAFESFGYGGCTGVNCAQVAAILGYKQIILVGIDGYKVDVIEGAEQSGRKYQLEVVAPTNYNPNYSRNTYQPVGLKYNRPQNDKCHRPAWAAFAKFAEENGIKVINCSWGDVADCFPRSTLPAETTAAELEPLVTFVMALKGRSKRALASIESVVTPENAKHIRFVVCEDKSANQLYLGKFPHYDLVTLHRLNMTETWNRSKLLNYGIKRATTKYVAGWDADFIFMPGCVTKYLERLRAMDGDAQYLNTISTETADNVRHKNGKQYSYKAGQMWGHFLTHLRRHVEAVKGYDEAFTFWGHEEVDLCNRLERQFGISETELREPGLLLHVSHDDTIRNKDKDGGERNRELRERHDREGRNIVNERGWGDTDMRPYVKKVYSQAGDDGIIQHIFELIGTTNKRCVEFGEKGKKGNTKLLRTDKGWKATLFDPNPLTSDSHKEFITAENVMDVFKKYKVPKIFDLLSIDIDGNDYWVWEALDEGVFKPRVVIIEFNPNFPIGDSRTIAYNPAHEYDKTIYYGASLTALQRLGRNKGYSLVHVESYLNLYFVADDLLPELIDIKSVFPFPLDIRAEAAKWNNRVPTWFDNKKNEARKDTLDRPWVPIKVERCIGSWRPDIHPSQQNKTMLIIGSGPSTQELVEFGFDNIPDNIDTFGMGAAYRYFEQINWWPTYYGWLDRKCVTCHWKALKQIVENPETPTKHFWFPRGISKSPRLTVAEHHSTGDQVFKMALEMGYDTILLIGVECDYVEMIPEAKPLHLVDPDRDREFRAKVQMPIPKDDLLVITKTPKFNPNYFFPGYQQEGDIFSRPNVEASHSVGWTRLVDKCRKNEELSVVNCSPISKVGFKRGNLKEELTRVHPISSNKVVHSAKMKIVLVGNGSGVLNGEYGEFVDSCDRILRMNDFEIKGYEKHVGSRLDIYGCGKQYFTRPVEFLAQFTERWHPCIRGTEPRKITEPAVLEKYWGHHIRTQFIEQTTFKRLVRAAKRAEPDAKWGPSSGMRFINMVFDTWPRAELYILGFDQLSTGHYFNPLPPYLERIQQGSTHREAVTWERRTINKYIKQGRVIRIDDVT